MTRAIVQRLILAALILGTGYFFARPFLSPLSSPAPVENTNSVNSTTIMNLNQPKATNETISPITNTVPNTNTNTTTSAPSIVLPIANFYDRVTKKPFGIYITPKTSPIQPEKFTGFHTGADAETTSAEAKMDVPVFSIAAGTVVFAGHVNGYGGVIMIKHTINGEKILTLYGHLRISSFKVKVGSNVTAGQPVAVLGTGYSSETDGERKHLHFGIIRGWTITYKGYVTTKSALSGWEDPVAWLQAHGV